jgi:hypothetical protein
VGAAAHRLHRTRGDMHVWFSHMSCDVMWHSKQHACAPGNHSPAMELCNQHRSSQSRPHHLPPGCTCVGGVVLQKQGSDDLLRLPLAGLFFAIGHEPATRFLGGQLALDELGYVITAPDSTATSVPGTMVTHTPAILVAGVCACAASGRKGSKQQCSSDCMRRGAAMNLVDQPCGALCMQVCLLQGMFRTANGGRL